MKKQEFHELHITDGGKKDKVFAKMTDEAIQVGTFIVNDLAESQLITKIKDGNLQAVMYWLNHKNKSYTNKLEVNNEVKHSIEITNEYKKLILKALGVAETIYEQKDY